jgi:hypothetical protein
MQVTCDLSRSANLLDGFSMDDNKNETFKLDEALGRHMNKKTKTKLKDLGFYGYVSILSYHEMIVPTDTLKQLLSVESTHQ